MRAVVQRVAWAKVSVAGEAVARIGPGALVLCGVSKTDTVEDALWLARKTAGLRIYPDAEGRMQRSLLETGGAVLVVSQFTLYGDCRKGRRPNFSQAAAAEQAESLYEAYCEALRAEGIADVQQGVFGAMMQVELCNDGPVTLIIDTPNGAAESPSG